MRARKRGLLGRKVISRSASWIIINHVNFNQPKIETEKLARFRELRTRMVEKVQKGPVVLAGNATI